METALIGGIEGEVRALTDQSDEVIEHHGQKFDSKRLARAAVMQLET